MEQKEEKGDTGYTGYIGEESRVEAMKDRMLSATHYDVSVTAGQVSG